MGKGSKAPSGPQEVVQTTSNLPEYAKPYFTEMLGRTMYETTRPYETFPGQRLQDFSDFEKAGMAGMYDMATRGDPAEIGIGSQVASDITQIASKLSVANPGQFLYLQFAMSKVSQIGDTLSNMVSLVNNTIATMVRNQK